MIELVVFVDYIIPIILYRKEGMATTSLLIINLVNVILCALLNLYTIIPFLILSFILALSGKTLDVSLSTIASIGLILLPIQHAILLILTMLAIILSTKKKHGRFVLYITPISIIVFLSMFLNLAQEPLINIMLFLMLFPIPIHKIISDYYDSSGISYIMVSLGIVIKILDFLRDYPVAITALSISITIMGIFIAMNSSKIEEFLYSLYFFTLGFIMFLVVITPVYISFMYLLVLTYSVIGIHLYRISHHLQGTEFEKLAEARIPNLGNLMIFITMIVYFAIASILSEILLEKSLHEFMLLPIGITSIFTSALSLAFFFRVYTVISSFSEERIIDLSIVDYASLMLGIVPLILLLYLINIKLELISMLLVAIIFISMLIGFLLTLLVKPKKLEPWLMGYEDLESLSIGGDITQWKQLFSSLYSLHIPDETVAHRLNKLNPLTSVIPIIIYAIYMLLEVI